MGMIGVMLSLQKTEPDVYTDTFIRALVPVSSTTHVSMSLNNSTSVQLIIMLSFTDAFFLVSYLD